MMLLLPVQWTWAAAASYCGHETGLAAKHFGHHDHQHKASGEVSKDSKPSPAGLDTDCGYCHLNGLQWIAPVETLAVSPAEAAPPPDDPPLSGSHITSGPERPDRLLAV